MTPLFHETVIHQIQNLFLKTLRTNQLAHLQNAKEGKGHIRTTQRTRQASQIPKYRIFSPSNLSKSKVGMEWVAKRRQ